MDYHHYILKVNEIATRQIHPDNYNLWIYPNSELKLIEYKFNGSITADGSGNIFLNFNTTYLPKYCYYLLQSNTKDCIYYYETGNYIKIFNEQSNYYIKNDTILSMYLLDNSMFPPQMKQLLSLKSSIDSTKIVSIKEDYIGKELDIKLQSSQINIGFTKFDSIDSLVYSSSYVNKDISIQYISDKISSTTNYSYYKSLLDGTKEELVGLLIKLNNNYIYHPIIVRYEPLVGNFITSKNEFSPKVQFTYNSIPYTKSFVVINTNNISITNNILNLDLVVGTINLTYNFTPLSSDFTINSQNQIIIKAGFKLSSLSYSLYLWKIKCINPTTKVEFNMYFWTLFSNSTQIINCYLNFGNSVLNGVSGALLFRTRPKCPYYYKSNYYVEKLFS
jgi:hypothetical protein